MKCFFLDSVVFARLDDKSAALKKTTLVHLGVCKLFSLVKPLSGSTCVLGEIREGVDYASMSSCFFCM